MVRLLCLYVNMETSKITVYFFSKRISAVSKKKHVEQQK